MKLSILNLTKTEIGKKELPAQFHEEIRADLVKKAVVAIESNLRQPYGADPMAGKRASAELSRRRHKYRGSYSLGISRVPRKILSRRGTRMNWVGAFAPGTVKGRRAHPPKVEKIWTKKLNTKERRKAIRSAISATVIKQLVEKRGHKVPENYPFIIDSKIEELSKTKEVIDALTKLGLTQELERSSIKKVRPGIGTMRGRRYRKKIGPLVVVSDTCKLTKSAKNIPGVEIVKVDKLNARHLAPGISIGRLTIFTENAINRMEKEQLFMNIQKEKKPKVKKEKVKKEKKVVKKTKPVVKKTQETKIEEKTTVKEEKVVPKKEAIENTEK